MGKQNANDTALVRLIFNAAAQMKNVPDTSGKRMFICGEGGMAPITTGESQQIVDSDGYEDVYAALALDTSLAMLVIEDGDLVGLRALKQLPLYGDVCTLQVQWPDDTSTKLVTRTWFLDALVIQAGLMSSRCQETSAIRVAPIERLGMEAYSMLFAARGGALRISHKREHVVRSLVKQHFASLCVA